MRQAGSLIFLKVLSSVGHREKSITVGLEAIAHLAVGGEPFYTLPSSAG